MRRGGEKKEKQEIREKWRGRCGIGEEERDAGLEEERQNSVLVF